MSLQSFTDAYIECALWASTADDGTPLDDSFGADDIAPKAMAKIKEDCKAFYDAHQAAWSTGWLWTDSQAGHDFWLTRNGHGAGFWDRYGHNEKHGAALGRYLTQKSKEYGSCDIYAGDDNLLYV